MKSFPLIRDTVTYFRTMPVGSQCIMTKGTKINKNLRGEFRQRGIDISHEGEYGNRIITYLGVNPTRVLQVKEYRASKALTTQYHIGQVKKNGIPANEPTYVQGNLQTLMRQLRKYVGSGNYCVRKTPDDPRGPGWTVTTKIPILP